MGKKRRIDTNKACKSGKLFSPSTVVFYYLFLCFSLIRKSALTRRSTRLLLWQVHRTFHYRCVTDWELFLFSLQEKGCAKGCIHVLLSVRQRKEMRLACKFIVRVSRASSSFLSSRLSSRVPASSLTHSHWQKVYGRMRGKRKFFVCTVCSSCVILIPSCATFLPSTLQHAFKCVSVSVWVNSLYLLPVHVTPGNRIICFTSLSTCTLAVMPTSTAVVVLLKLQLRNSLGKMTVRPVSATLEPWNYRSSSLISNSGRKRETGQWVKAKQKAERSFYYCFCLSVWTEHI